MEATKLCAVITGCAPVRCCSVHYCDESNQPSEIASTVEMYDLKARLRTRSHVMENGNYKKLFIELMTFGLPTSLLPIDENGMLHLDNLKYHQLFLEQRKELESQRRKQNSKAQTEQTRYVTSPHSLDILYGSKALQMGHVGNAKYNGVIADRYDEWDEQHRLDKKEFHVKIYDEIGRYGGRLLGMQNTGWVELSSKDAIDKISQAFRNRRRTVTQQELRP